MKSETRSPAQLQRLLQDPALRLLDTLYLPEETVLVRDLVVVRDIDEISSLAPETLIFLSPDFAQGAWVVSAALRYAWERKASGIVVPTQALGDTLAELAQKLEVSLFVSQAEIVPAALEFAEVLGKARSEAQGRTDELRRQIESRASLEAALEAAAQALGGCEISLGDGDLELMRSGSTLDAAEKHQGHYTEPYSRHSGARTDLVTLDVPGPSRYQLSARVESDRQEDARAVLAAVVPTVRAFLAEGQLRQLRASLPVIAAASYLDADPADLRSAHGPSAQSIAMTSSVPPRALAVCFVSSDAERLGGAIVNAWALAAPNAPLHRFRDAWIGFVSADHEGSRAAVRAALTRALPGLSALPVSIGFSAEHLDDRPLNDAMREGWLAANCAQPGTTLAFEDITIELVPRILSSEIAEAFLRSLAPRFMGDDAVGLLAPLVLTVLDNGGSISQTAAALGVHRNTVQQRLSRATALGLEWNNPHQRLGLHLLLAAWSRAHASLVES